MSKRKKLRVCWTAGTAGSTGEAIIELDGTETEEEIEELARDEAFNNISWGYSVVEDEDD